METVFSSPLFGLTVFVMTYHFGAKVYQKWPYPFLNPLLIAVLFLISVIIFTPLDYSHLKAGGDIINLFLAPVTAVLAIPMYEQLPKLTRNILPVLIGCMAGSLTGLLSVFALAKLFNMNWILTASLLPKSITTPMGIELSIYLGGIPAITVLMIILTGLFGATFSASLCRVLKIKDPIAQGIAIGSSSHALGTTKAMEMGDVQGALSSISIAMTGLFTVFWAVLLTFFGLLG